MDAVTTGQLLFEIRNVCAASRIVSRIEQRYIDTDILDVRVHLTSNSFISVFYNLDSNKTSFALIQDAKRTMGADNAKMGWHRHPFGTPEQHEPCEPVTFRDFVAQVETQFESQE